MKPQATRYTQKQLAYLAYWEQRGYTFGRNENIPETVEAPPSFATRHPIADALIGSLLLAVFIGAAVSGWVSIGAGWAP